MAFDQRFLEELRQRIPLHSIISRKVKVARSGRHWKACCPFHGEKTPSFYIYDDHFHCYGCGVHGDVISFVMQNEGRTFNEAVTELAALAGIEVPEQTPQQKQRQEQQHDLYELMAAAHEYYLSEFQTNKAKIARDYLLDRGITPQTIRHFGLCWSGDGRGGLIQHLKSKEYSLEMIGEAGLLRKQADGQWGGELFFNRVMYPIYDRRGRVIAFGGRIIGEGQPKYLNSPETPLFSKRRILFGLNHLSSVFSRKDIDPLFNTILVVEGYMDVIALYQAGFHGAVAPLGTALTQDQLALLWRASSQPVLSFDGDGAGRKAMLHAAEEALPILTPEQTLNFIALPEGEDPDSFIQNNGVNAFLEIIRHKLSLSEMLYNLSVDAMTNRSPEQRAALRKRLTSIAEQIKDKNLAKEYRKVLLDRFYEQFYSKNKQSNYQSPYGKKQNDKFNEHLMRPVLQKDQVEYQRMCILIALLIYCPRIISSVEDALCRLDLPEELSKLREILLDFPLDCDNINSYLQERNMIEVTKKILNHSNLTLINHNNYDKINDFGLFEKQWWHYYGWLNIHELENQVTQAQQDWINCPDEEHQRTLIARLNALDAVKRGEIDV
ncbi:DNA primase (bacterial type) (DnaG) (PDB:3B39) (PUBMED:28128549) [Commensalibacter communis]|uniref:DNA primase n=1 Tax=Commensalibacter communis TaxID=2972786 RepID=UPI0022FF603E|nr:DNA primase [Commensalibacter communis]CAI3926618.1 DNA primase (bacterial type) (DnaG) (PDB:3B39) (PUBMED:28128549) [Commensalibacter communis]CAI3932735.1 DNA primase (bacterial type) (DnaG) (PDB:3B39) (PUBMED:28128549) [Commensalibacter communis]